MREGVITALEIQGRNKKRVNVYLDGEFAFSLSLAQAAKLTKGQTLSQAEIEALRDEDAVVQAVDRAARFLSYRARSVEEVRRYLARKETAPKTIDAALARLSKLGYLDDHAFARQWVRSRDQSASPRGTKALRYELRQKGVPDVVIAEALDGYDEDDAAYRAACRHLPRLRGLERHAFRIKMGTFLQRRGFSAATARQVIRRLIAEIETDNPDYFDTGEEE